MFNFGMPELFLVLIIALVIFGPGKLPDIGKALGKGISEFKGAVSHDTKSTTSTSSEDTTLRTTGTLKKSTMEASNEEQKG